MSRWHAASVAVAAASYLALVLTSIPTHSGTFDEAVYLPAGYAALTQGDYRINTVHPPLAKLLSAVPLLFLDVKMDRGDGAWIEAHPWKFGRRFLYEWNDADRLLVWGRAATAGLGLALVIAVWVWTRRHWGAAAASLAAALCALNPEVLAHGGLATNDMAVACFFFFSVIAFERLLAGAAPRGLRVLAAGGCLGAALLSKHSALLLPPCLGLLAVLHALRAGPEPRRRRLARNGGWLLATAVIAYGVVWAGYRFRYAAAADPSATEALAWKIKDTGTAGRAVRTLTQHHLLPEAYGHGLVDLLSRSQARRAYLLGRYSSEGWWYYFPVTFALKTPLPLLLLLGLAGVAAVRARTGGGPGAFLWLPPAVYLAVALTTSVNIGHRYLLPIAPFGFVAAGRAAARLMEHGRRGPLAVALLLAWYAAGTVRNHPHHLAYFNALAGGPEGGWRHLADSNVDWGQDLKRLRRYVEDKQVPRLKLSYFGTAPPDRYGIPHDLLPSAMRPIPERVLLHVRPGDLVAVSATNLHGVYLPRAVRGLMAGFRDRAPVDRVGRSIFVYRAETHWLLRPELAAELYWLDDAIASYRECLRLDPDEPEAQAFLDRALRLKGEAPPPPEPEPDTGDDAG